jgi:outer membrane receptor for Fe3+-dicitrate
LALSRQWVPLDHDQRWTASGGVAHAWGASHVSLDFIAGTGLRAGDLNANHLPGYAVLNFALRRSINTWLVGEIEWSLSVINLLDRAYELRDGTGVGVGAPQWGQRRSVYLGFSRAFGG